MNAPVKLPPIGQTVIDMDTLTVTYERRSPTLLLAEANRQHALATELEIDSDSMFQEGAELLQKIVGKKKSLDEERLAFGKPLRDEQANLNAAYKPAIDLYETSEKFLKQVLTKYTDDKERERQRLQRIADEAARVERERVAAEARAAQKKAEAEAAEARRAAQAEADERTRVAAEAAAESQRLADEAAAAGDAERAAELEAEAKKTVEVAATTAKMLIAHGDHAAKDVLESSAAEVKSQQAVAQMMTPAVVQIARPKVSGIGTGKKYTAEVTDSKAFLTWVLSNYEHFAHFVEVNQGALNRYAADQKERLSVAGAELRTVTTMSSRRA